MRISPAWTAALSTVALVAGLLISAPPALAAAPLAQLAAAPTLAAINPQSLGVDVLIEGRKDPKGPNANPTQTVTFNVNQGDPSSVDGSVKIQVGVVCLDMGASTLARGANCQATKDQDFYLVPVRKDPNADPHSNPDDHWFYIVSSSRDQCLASPSGGLFPQRGGSGNNNVRSETCKAGEYTQEFRISTDPADSVTGVNPQWKFVLATALQYATAHCGAFVGRPENSPCLVALDSAPSTWMAPRSESALSAGTYGSASVGCGTPTGAAKYNPKEHNLSDTPTPQTIGSTGSTSHTNSTTVGGSATWSYSITTPGPEDMFSTKQGVSFTVQGEKMWSNEDTSSNDNSITIEVPASSWGMSTWSATVLTFAGQWLLGRDTVGGLYWSTKAVSSFPAASPNNAPGLTFTPVTSFSEKDCTAGTASVNVTRPVISTSTCADQPAQVAAGTTLTVCPGTWNTPGIDPVQNFRYRWFTAKQGDTASKIYIDGEVGATLHVQPSMYSQDGIYIGAEVLEAGPVSRLESSWALASNQVKVLPAPVSNGDLQPFGTVFTSMIPDATIGEPYDASVVIHAGSGMALATDGAEIDGLAISFDGVLSGTPTRAGDYAFTVTDTPTDGGAVQTRPFTLHVVGEEIVPVEQTSFHAVVGEPFAERLISSPASGAGLRVTGDLPHGFTLDESTGLLAGTPTTEASTTFTVSSGWHTTPITVDVGDSLSTVTTDALPVATVGVPYEAKTLSALGTHPLIGLANDSQSLDGLILDARTGLISGTPTEAGTLTLRIGDLNAPEQSAVTKTLTIVAAASGATAPTGAKAATLAATGADAVPPLGLGGLLVALGVVAMWLRRRRRAQS